MNPNKITDKSPAIFVSYLLGGFGEQRTDWLISYEDSHPGSVLEDSPGVCNQVSWFKMMRLASPRRHASRTGFSYLFEPLSERGRYF